MLELTPAFNPSVKEYTAVMPADAETLSFKAYKNNPDADWGNTTGTVRIWCMAVKLYDVAQMGMYNAQVPSEYVEEPDGHSYYEFTTESPLSTDSIPLAAGDGSGELAKQVVASIYVQHNGAVNTYSITVNRAEG